MPKKMYRLFWASGRYHDDFCQKCAKEAWKQDYIESSSEIESGTCYICGYKKEKED
jgi:hypothetical protein